MKRKYKILNIKHSGRKDIRGAPVNDDKYNGLIGSIIETDDILDLYEFDISNWKFINTESNNEDWETSEVIDIIKNDKTYELETINIIYTLEDITDD